MRYLFLRENALLILWSTLDSIFQKLDTLYTKYFVIIGVSALTVVIRVRVDFHCRVIFLCVRA